MSLPLVTRTGPGEYNVVFPNLTPSARELLENELGAAVSFVGALEVYELNGGFLIRLGSEDHRVKPRSRFIEDRSKLGDAVAELIIKNKLEK